MELQAAKSLLLGKLEQARGLDSRPRPVGTAPGRQLALLELGTAVFCRQGQDADMSAAGRVLAAAVGVGDKLPRAAQGGDLHPPPEPAGSAAFSLQTSSLAVRERKAPCLAAGGTSRLHEDEVMCEQRTASTCPSFPLPSNLQQVVTFLPLSSVITASPCLALHHASVIWGKKAHFPLNGHQGCLLAHLSDGPCVWYTCL